MDQHTRPGTESADQPAAALLRQIWAAVGSEPAALERVKIDGNGALPAAFPVSDLAAAAIAAAGLAISELAATRAARQL
jgi:hypothetical protein